MKAENAWWQVTLQPGTTERALQMKLLPHSCKLLYIHTAFSKNGFDSDPLKCVLVLQEKKLNDTENYWKLQQNYLNIFSKIEKSNHVKF